MKLLSNIPAWPLLFSLKRNQGLPLLFLLLVSMPLADSFLSIARPKRLFENRRLSAKPRFQWGDPAGYLKKYEAYFNDNFGFRNTLLVHHNTIMVRNLKTSPLARIVVGKNGWFFLDREDREPGAIDYFRCLRPFSLPELEAWKTGLRQRHAWFSARGIVYLFIVVPNKDSIYPEFLPASIRRLGTQTRLEQLLSYLKKEPSIPIIDFRKELLLEKSKSRLFPKTDSHWSPMGAYLAYVKIIAALSRHFPGLRPYPQHELYRVEKNYPGDLVKMLSLDRNAFLEPMIRLRMKPDHVRYASASRGKYGPGIDETVDRTPDAPWPPLLMIHDSFQRRLRPFLSRHFRKVIYISDRKLPIYKELIDANQIKIVIDQRVERALMFQVLDNSAIAD